MRKSRGSRLAWCASVLLLFVVAGCSTAALNEPLNFAIACRPDAGLKLARGSAASDGIIDPVLGKVAELAILKDAGRTNSYEAASTKLIAEYPSLNADELDQAISSKVDEMRASREKATGGKTC